MTETERILRAMALMDEFTVADLVRACDARSATVRTVLLRHKNDLEDLGIAQTGRRGGQWKRYRLRPDAAEALVNDAEGVPAGDGVPHDLLAAEQLLLAPQTATVDAMTRASLLRRARRFSDDARQAGALTPATDAHQRAVDVLITLAEGEEAGDVKALFEARRRLEVARGSLATVGGSLLSDLERRLELSPLAEQTTYTLAGQLAEVVELVSSLAHRASKSDSDRQSRLPTARLIAAQARRRKLDPDVASMYLLDVAERRSTGWVPGEDLVPWLKTPPSPVPAAEARRALTASFGTSNQRVTETAVSAGRPLNVSQL